MKAKLIILAIASAQALRLAKPFKMGEDTIDFDEDADIPEPVVPVNIVTVSFDDLYKADAEMLKDFPQILSSAKRNADKGDLN